MSAVRSEIALWMRYLECLFAMIAIHSFIALKSRKDFFFEFFLGSRRMRRKMQ
jgi:hypothetical protein